MENREVIVEVFKPRKVESKSKPSKLLNNRYRLIQKISSTSMSMVYKAEDTKDNSTVAIKISNKNEMNDKFRLRWEKEIVIQKLWMNVETDDSRDYLVKLIDTFNIGNNFCAVYPWMNDSLKKKISEKGKMSLSSAMDIFSKVCKGVQIYHNWEYKIKDLNLEAADPGIIHRDIKPQNILFDEFNNPKLLDVGISLFRDSRIDNEVNKNIIEENNLQGFDMSFPKITSEGSIVGSVQYIDPEVTLGRQKKNIPQVDIYSLGILLYEMLNGEVPFSGDSISEIAAKHIRSTPELLKDKLNYNVPPIVDNIITRCTAKGKEFSTLRYKNIEQLISDIDKFFDNANSDKQDELIRSERTIKKVIEKKDVFMIEKEKQKKPLYFNLSIILILWLTILFALATLIVLY